MDSKCIVKCANPACGRQLSIPTDRGKIRVTCPSCKMQWCWSPSEAVPEMRELPFRCAVSGQRFRVAFGRYHPNHKYRVVHVSLEAVQQAPPAAPPSAGSLLTKLLDSFHDRGRIAHDSSESPRQAPPRLQSSSHSLLTRLRESIVPQQSSQPLQPSNSGPRDSQAFDANEFDFAGWYCPCCGYCRDAPVYPPFVRCGTCDECVCCGRVTRVNASVATFECHDGCKGGGRLSGQLMTTLKGSPIDPTLPSAALADRSGLKPAAELPASPVPRERARLPDRPRLGDKP